MTTDQTDLRPDMTWVATRLYCRKFASDVRSREMLFEANCSLYACTRAKIAKKGSSRDPDLRHLVGLCNMLHSISARLDALHMERRRAEVRAAFKDLPLRFTMNSETKDFDDTVELFALPIRNEHRNSHTKPPVFLDTASEMAESANKYEDNESSEDSDDSSEDSDNDDGVLEGADQTRNVNVDKKTRRWST
ncbi:hypothetical protein LTR66_005573 [Elasticomyces elasticus]|nr:hypothetical protein LTR28_013865 [Elasticomyces elasticus]KAK4994383.1 hypothetical protein LTR66_005573 [Elasticomyces elasticus]